MGLPELPVGGFVAYQNHQIIDLTQELYEGQPVFVGHPETRIWAAMTHEVSARLGRFVGEMTYCANILQLCDHGPTHVDSISHIDPRPGAPTIDRIPLEWFYTPAICLDLSDVPPRSSIPKERVVGELRRTGLQIPRGGTVLFTTGHYLRTYPRKEYTTEYAGLSREAAEFIYVEGGAMNIGADAPSIDNAADPSFPCHVLCRHHQRINTENLCNLEAVAGKQFLFIGLPLKIRGGTGSPIRAVAILNA